jgi:hypothetical protein
MEFKEEGEISINTTSDIENVQGRAMDEISHMQQA